jgi:hypothetical protein
MTCPSLPFFLFRSSLLPLHPTYSVFTVRYIYQAVNFEGVVTLLYVKIPVTATLLRVPPT